MNIILFGQLAELAGTELLEVYSISDTDMLRKKIIADFPTFSQVPFTISVNRKIIIQNSSINSDSEIALLPPFAGG